MQVLEKQKIINKVNNISDLDIEKIMISKENYKKNKKSYSIWEAHSLGLSKLDF